MTFLIAFLSHEGSVSLGGVYYTVLQSDWKAGGNASSFDCLGKCFWQKKLQTVSLSLHRKEHLI